MKKNCLFILMYCNILCFSIGYSQNFNFKFLHLNVDDGLSHTDSKAVCQDSKGFIWIGTLYGLDRYDGYEIKKFYNNNDPLNNAFKNRIRDVIADTDGKIWLATDDGIQCFDSKSEKYITLSYPSGKNNYDYRIIRLIIRQKNLIAISSDHIEMFKMEGNKLMPVQLPFPVTQLFNWYNMVEDKFSNIWLSGNTGIWLLTTNNKIQLFEIRDINGVRYNNIEKIYINRDGSFILLSNNKLLQVLNFKSGIVEVNKLMDFENTSVTDFIQSDDYSWWFSTINGLVKTNRLFDNKITITSQSGLNSLSSNSLDRLFIDHSNCLWICTFGGGINCLDLKAKQFYTLQRNPELDNTLSGNHIRSILEEPSGNVWIGTNANGLNYYNIKTGKYSFYSTKTYPVTLKSNEISALVMDKANRLWIGTPKGVQILSSDRKKLEMPLGSNLFPSGTIENLSVDFFGNIWFGSYTNGAGRIIVQNKKGYITQYIHAGKIVPRPAEEIVSFVYADPSRPEVFIGTSQGLYRYFIKVDGNISRSFYYHAGKSDSGLSSDYIWPIERQNDTLLWVGTLGGGLNRVVLKTDGTIKTTNFTSNESFFIDVESLQIDKQGNIWMGGNGLEVFDPLTNRIIKFNKDDGLQGNSFKVGSSFKGKNGRLYFGGVNGLNYFNPDSITRSSISVKPELTELFVNNIPYNKCISFLDRLDLGYLENNFVIYFSAMHFANPQKCRYRYKLEGFDKDWKYVNEFSHSVAFSNLDYGTYHFILQATNNDGLWSPEISTISIRIHPPWWKSLLAKIVYILLGLASLAGILFYNKRWHELKNELVITALEEKKKEEMHNQQLQFFTNISHELRSPLSMIIGPLENLLRDQAPAGSRQYYHQIMYRNSKRLMNLINELMNFRKLADGALVLRTQQVNLGNFLQELSDTFNQLAKEKDISFTVNSDTLPEDTWFDFQILEKILFNLLNNAFKYTSNGGCVFLKVCTNWNENCLPSEGKLVIKNTLRFEKYIYFSIRDTGIGIADEFISHIFDRYYRVSDSQIGSGVGLNLVKTLTILHKGDVYVHSKSLEGTEVIIGLPYLQSNYNLTEQLKPVDEAQMIKLEKLELVGEQLSVEINIGSNASSEQPLYKQHVLIIEDNIELRQLMVSNLSQYYHISQGADGLEGWDIALKLLPDLIISDIMMPNLDGIEFCNRVKSNINTSHIPFMMLTAKNSEEDIIGGVVSGADFYFTKPISLELLLLTVHNILEQKEKLKQKYKKDYYVEARELVNNKMDKDFIDSFIKIIEEQLHNPELNVDYICKRLYIGRTSLFQKIKNISGQSVNEFVRSLRLKKAAHILSHEPITIAEVADRVGIQSISYFTRAFKKEFGKTPGEFLRDNHIN